MKVQILISANTFEEACRALSDLAGRSDNRLQQSLEACNAVSINEERTVWLQQAAEEGADVPG